jgi:hypothetical protein
MGHHGLLQEYLYLFYLTFLHSTHIDMSQNEIRLTASTIIVQLLNATETLEGTTREGSVLPITPSIPFGALWSMLPIL